MIEFPLVLAGIKNGKDVIKLIIDSPHLLEKSEMEVKLASVNRSFFEAETALLESQKLLKEKDSKIEELENALKFKENLKLIRHKSMFFESDENENPIKTAYCPTCWINESKAFQMVKDRPGKASCPNCKLEAGKNFYP